MATEQEQVNITLKAEADLSSFQYRCVKMTNSGFGTLSSGGTFDSVLGIQQNKPGGYGRALKVCIDGLTKVYAGESIAVGDFVSPFGGGSVKKGESNAAGTATRLIGQSITTAGGSGQLIEIILGKSLNWNV